MQMRPRSKGPTGSARCAAASLWRRSTELWPGLTGRSRHLWAGALALLTALSLSGVASAQDKADNAVVRALDQAMEIYIIQPEEREALQRTLAALKENGVPDTIAYLTEDEVLTARRNLEELGYDSQALPAAFAIPPQGVDYTHLFFREP